MRVYLVGGAVRDRLLGLPVHERDWVVVGETPESMRAQGFVPLDGEFPVFRHPGTGDEYALARTETKHGAGHRGFALSFGPEVTLEQDLARRDLTVNAIAEDAAGEHVDPFGGLADLHDRRLVHVTRAFVDDPLRLLRAARFAARLAPLGFALEPSTLRLMTSMATQPELQSLSAERVWRELRLGLAAPRPRVMVEVLDGCGALHVLLPALTDDFSSAEGDALRALDEAAAGTEDVELRLAAWLGAGLRDQTAPSVARDLAAALALRAPTARLLARLQGLRRDLLRHADDSSTADAWLRTLEAADAMRQPDQLLRLLPALRAVLLTRTASADLLVKRLCLALAAARKVKASSLAATGLRGAELGEALRRERARAVEASLVPSR